MNPSSLLTRGAVVVAGLALAGSSVACSSGKGTADKSSSDGGSTAAQTDTGVASAPGTKGDPAQVLHRAVVADGKLARVTFDFKFGIVIGLQDQQFEISGKLNRTDPAAQVTASVGGQKTLELRTEGDTAWLRSATPAFRKAMPAGKTWAKGSVRALERQSTITPVNRSVALLYYLEGAKDIKAKGSEQLDGTEVTHYTFSVDRGQAEDRAPGDRRAEVHKLMTPKGSTRLSVTGEVWLDHQARVRRMRAHGRLTSGSATSASNSDPFAPEGRIDYELRQAGFDQKVTVEKPSPSATIDINSVPGLITAFKQSQSGSGSSSDNSDSSDSFS